MGLVLLFLLFYIITANTPSRDYYGDVVVALTFFPFCLSHSYELCGYAHAQAFKPTPTTANEFPLFL